MLKQLLKENEDLQQELKKETKKGEQINIELTEKIKDKKYYTREIINKQKDNKQLDLAKQHATLLTNFMDAINALFNGKNAIGRKLINIDVILKIVAQNNKQDNDIFNLTPK
ncbi:Hypothetical_protein [Hexamita inflata]|uniref:Hypothetical_protein n=1 Tax=Hexamita inflata TaxID=28002 RepID=A0AA86NF85_9EUKA|nr:Hypothetical protein HINF_LOCUS6174 [Hexamita inflata]